VRYRQTNRSVSGRIDDAVVCLQIRQQFEKDFARQEARGCHVLF
jgi:hypothetical protein